MGSRGIALEYLSIDIGGFMFKINYILGQLGGLPPVPPPPPGSSTGSDNINSSNQCQTNIYMYILLISTSLYKPEIMNNEPFFRNKNCCSNELSAKLGLASSDKQTEHV